MLFPAPGVLMRGYSYFLYLRVAYDQFQEFFRKGNFIDSTHMKLYSPSK